MVEVGTGGERKPQTQALGFGKQLLCESMVGRPAPSTNPTLTCPYSTSPSPLPSRLVLCHRDHLL